MCIRLPKLPLLGEIFLNFFLEERKFLQGQLLCDVMLGEVFEDIAK